MKLRITALAAILALLCASSCMMPGIDIVEPEFDIYGAKTEDIKERVLELVSDTKDDYHDFYDYDGTDFERKVALYVNAHNLLVEAIKCYEELHRRHVAINPHYYTRKHTTDDGRRMLYPNYFKYQRDTEGILLRLLRLDPREHDLLKPTEGH